MLDEGQLMLGRLQVLVAVLVAGLQLCLLWSLWSLRLRGCYGHEVATVAALVLAVLVW